MINGNTVELKYFFQNHLLEYMSDIIKLSDFKTYFGVELDKTQMVDKDLIS